MKKLDKLLQEAEAMLKLRPSEAAARLEAMDIDGKLGLVLSLPPDRRRLEFILLDKDPASLVQALPPEEWLLTLKTIGVTDAIELLELSSDEQAMYLADLELWTRDGVDLSRFAWLNHLFFSCSADRLKRWMDKLDFEIWDLFIERTVVPVDREAIPDLPDKLADRVVTPDNYHFLVVRLGADVDAVRRVIDFMYSELRELFFALWGNIGTTPPAEVEELARRWRDGRLADRGWPDLEQAYEVLKDRDPRLLQPVALPRGWSDPPRSLLKLGAEGSLLEQVMNLVGEPERIASQIANLVNRLIVVQGLPASEPESVRAAAEQLSSRLELALEISSATTVAEAAGLLERYPLLHLLQVANHEVDARARRARKLAKKSAHLGGLLDDPLPEVLNALKPLWPLFYSANKLQPEQFRSKRQLEITDAQLDMIEAYIRFCEAAGISEQKLPRRMPPGSFPPDKPSLNCSVLLATLFGRSRLALPAVLGPLPIESLGTLLDSLPESPEELKRLIEQWLEELVHPVPAATGRIASVLARLLGGYMEVPFDRFDPRFVEGLWLVRGGATPD